MTTPSFSGSSFLISPAAPYAQTDPAVAALSGGRMVGVWTESGPGAVDTSGTGLRGQILLADGTRQGLQFAVNTETTSTQFQPAVTTLSNGGFVVTWTSASPTGGDGSAAAIKAQVFSASGARVGGEFLVNEFGYTNQTQPAVVALDGGGFAVTFQTPVLPGGNLEELGLRIFNNDGTPRGGEINWTIGNLTALRSPEITQLTNGNLVVTWQQLGDMAHDTDNAGIMGRIFTAAGAGVTGNVGINTTTAGAQLDSEVAALNNGRFVVTWTDNSGASADTSGVAVRAQLFGPGGGKIGAEQLVNTTTADNQIDPTVTTLSDGRYLIAWTDQGTGSGWTIKAQLYNANGVRSGSELLVSAGQTGNQAEPAITELSDGRILVGWRDAGQNAGDIQGQIIDPREAAVSYTGTAGPNIAEGTRFGDTLAGAGGDDRLFGAAGNDRLSGGNGADRLNGGIGADTLNGGNGADVFVFSAASASTVAAAGQDLITGFSRAQGDRIDLSAIDANALIPGNDACVLTASPFFTGLGQLRVTQTGGNTVIDLNIGGSNASDMRIVVAGLHSLGAGAFDL